jgi:hypothetical protein
LRIILATAFALSLLLAVVLLGRGETIKATSFDPTSVATLADPATSANSNVIVTYTVDSPQARPASRISFLPSAFGAATGASVPNGARVGSLSVTRNESNSNGPCNSSLFIGVELLDASTNTGDTIADSPRIPSASWPGFADANPANGLADAVDKYPSFLNTLYPGLTPRARSFGWVDAGVAGINRAVNVLVFDPGTTLPGVGALDASLGYPVVIVEQDPTAPAASSSVTGICTSMEYIRVDRGITQDNFSTGANESGFVYRTNPSTNGTYRFVTYSVSIRDADNDGIENTLDGCPTVSTPSWNPRISDPVNDPDNDGIPGQDDPAFSGEQLLAGTGCDPTPITLNGDQDSDGYLNREDNCPLVANGLAGNNQADTDGDAIGDSCDPIVNVPDGHLHEGCSTSDVVVGSGGTPPSLACPDVISDEDNDGFSTTVELHIGTNPYHPCGGAGWPLNLYTSGGSAYDVDVQDLTSFLAPTRYLDTDVGAHPGDVRWDLVPGKGVLSTDINAQDFNALIVSYPPMLNYQRALDGPDCPYP